MFDDYKRRVSSPSLRIAMERAGVSKEDVSSVNRDSIGLISDEDVIEERKPEMKTQGFDIEKALDSIRSSSKDVMDKKSRFAPTEKVEKDSFEHSEILDLCRNCGKNLSEEKISLIRNICEKEVSPYPDLDKDRLELRSMTDDEKKAVCRFMIDSDTVGILPKMEKLTAQDGSFFWTYRLFVLSDISDIKKLYPDGKKYVIQSIRKGTLGGLIRDITTFGFDCWCEDTSIIEGSVSDNSFILGFSYIGENVSLKNSVVSDSVCGQLEKDGLGCNLIFDSCVVSDSVLSGIGTFKSCSLNGYEHVFDGEKHRLIIWDENDVYPVNRTE